MSSHFETPEYTLRKRLRSPPTKWLDSATLAHAKALGWPCTAPLLAYNASRTSASQHTNTINHGEAFKVLQEYVAESKI